MVRKIAQISLGSALIYTGLLHLTISRIEFQAQVPKWLPFDPDFVVISSGIVEILLGLAIVSLRWREKIGALTALFFILIFPGNISQFVNGIDAFGLNSDRARAIRLLFQPVLVIWALWATDAIPTGALQKSWSFTKRFLSENKGAAFFGFICGGVITRFLEDGNLLVTSAITLICMAVALAFWESLKRLRALMN